MTLNSSLINSIKEEISLQTAQQKNLLLEIYDRLYNRFGPQHWWPGESPLEIMVGAILTQNTNWQNVEKSIKNIKEAHLLEARLLLKNRKRIPELVKPSGFYRLKAQRLINFLKFFVNRYEGKVEELQRVKTERLRLELLAVPGIGPETADSILLYALNRAVFVVDAYTRRIFARHKIIGEKSKYEEIRQFFEENLPCDFRLYNEYHALLVKLGKIFCKKNEPLCNNCPLLPFFAGS